MTTGVTEDKIMIIMGVEEEDDMMIAGETIQAATLILADAIDEIQTGDLPQKMISERLQQKRLRLDPGLNCNHERLRIRLIHWLKRCKNSQFLEALSPVKRT